MSNTILGNALHILFHLGSCACRFPIDSWVRKFQSKLWRGSQLYWYDTQEFNTWGAQPSTLGTRYFRINTRSAWFSGLGFEPLNTQPSRPRLSISQPQLLVLWHSDFGRFSKSKKISRLYIAKMLDRRVGTGVFKPCKNLSLLCLYFYVFICFIFHYIMNCYRRAHNQRSTTK